MKGTNIKVLVRASPLPENQSMAFKLTDNTISFPDSSSPFLFDYCFAPSPFQDKIFSCLESEIIECLEKGYNYCVFAYGQTGSGKSYTILGDESNPGILPQSIDTIIQYLQKSKEGKIFVSMLQIYNEKISDLLSDTPNSNLSLSLGIDKNYIVNYLKESQVSTQEQLETLYKKGLKKRFTACTSMNKVSSRSHLIFRVKIQIGHRYSVFQIIDLAGSERVGKSEVTGKNFTEAVNINTSLFCLGKVINQLSEGSKLISYNESVLTKIMKGGIGGNSKTTVIINVSSSKYNESETKSSLNYGIRLKKIKTDPKTNLIYEQNLDKMRLLLKEEQERNKKNEDVISQLNARIKELEEEERKLKEKKSKIIKEKSPYLQYIGEEYENRFTYKLKSKNIITSTEMNENKNEDSDNANDKEDNTKYIIIPGIATNHCEITKNEKNESFISLINGNKIYINGKEIYEKTKLEAFDRIIIEESHFLLYVPPSAKKSEVISKFDYWSFLYEKYQSKYPNLLDKKKGGNVDISEKDLLKLLIKVDWANKKSEELQDDKQFSVVCNDNQHQILLLKNDKTEEKWTKEQFLKEIKKYKLNFKISDTLFTKNINQGYIQQNQAKIEKLEEKLKETHKTFKNLHEKLISKRNELILNQNNLKESKPNNNNSEEQWKENIENLDNQIKTIDRIILEYSLNFQNQEEISENINMNLGISICKNTINIISKIIKTPYADRTDEKLNNLINKIEEDVEETEKDIQEYDENN